MWWRWHSPVHLPTVICWSLLFTDHNAEAGGAADNSLKPPTHRNKDQLCDPKLRRHGRSLLRIQRKERPDLPGIASLPPPGEQHLEAGDGDEEEEALRWTRGWDGDGDEHRGEQEAAVGCCREEVHQLWGTQGGCGALHQAWSPLLQLPLLPKCQPLQQRLSGHQWLQGWQPLEGTVWSFRWEKLPPCHYCFPQDVVASPSLLVLQRDAIDPSTSSYLLFLWAIIKIKSDDCLELIAVCMLRSMDNLLLKCPLHMRSTLFPVDDAQNLFPKNQL